MAVTSEDRAAKRERVRKAYEPGKRLALIAKEAGVSWGTVRSYVKEIEAKGHPEAPPPISLDPGLRQAPYQKAEYRVDLLAELRKRREALDAAIRALEIFEQ